MIGTGRARLRVLRDGAVHVSSGAACPRPPPSTRQQPTALVTRVVSSVRPAAPDHGKRARRPLLRCAARPALTPRHAKRDAESHDTTRPPPTKRRNAATRDVRACSMHLYPRVRPTPISRRVPRGTGNAMRLPAAAATRPRPREGRQPRRERDDQARAGRTNDALPSRIFFWPRPRANRPLRSALRLR